MTLHTDSDASRQLPRGNGASLSSSGERSLKTAISEIGQILNEQLGRVRAQAAPMTDGAGRQLSVAGQRALDEARRRPVMTTLAVVGAGIGLAMLLSGRARAGAAGAGSEAWKAYKRHRR